MQKLNNRGQALTEMAVLGIIIMALFGVLLSYIQKLNDQQYVQMDSFRRGLKEAMVYKPQNKEEGKGAVLHYDQTENHRYVNTANNFMLRSPNVVRSTNDIFWAVPDIEKNDTALVANQVVCKMNNEGENDEQVQREKYDKYSGGRLEEEIFITSLWSAGHELEYDEKMQKQETTTGITTARSSNIKDDVNNTVTGKLHTQDRGQDVRTLTQGIYKEGEGQGQYKYSADAVGKTVNNTRPNWSAEF